MLRKSTFLDQIHMYRAVVVAYLKNKIVLDLCDIRAIHYCLDTGLQYVVNGSEDSKIIKSLKVSLKSEIEELSQELGVNTAIKQSIKNVSIQELFFQLPNQEEESSFFNKLDVQPLHL